MRRQINKRPFSSSPNTPNIKNKKKKLKIFSSSLSTNDLIPNNMKTYKFFQNKTNFSKGNSQYKSRPQTTKFSINRKLLQSNLFSKSDNKLDCLNLIIDSNPNQYNIKLIKKKMMQINPLFIYGSEQNLKRPKLSYNTDEVYYKYNLLYANKTKNLIKTYSPKMRPTSSSISTFLKKMKYNLKENIPIFDEEEMLIFAKEKCKDIGIELRDNILCKFKDFCKTRCKNRVADLSDNYFGINSMKFIVNILYNYDRISILNLSKNNFGDEGIELLINAVKDSLSLVSLDISSNSISYKGGEHIFSIFINQQSIIHLDVSSHEGINRNRLTSKGIKNIIKYLKNNLFIESLNLSGNSLKNEGFDLICKGLNNNISLNNLNISHNDIQNTGIKKSLKIINTTKLYSINLSNNPILDEGLITFANSLRHFPELRILNISNCGIEFKGFKELLKVLQSVRRIETLDISKNKLGSKEFEELKIYFNSFGIKYLNLSRCQLGDISAYPLGESLQQNETIRKLNISNNKITDNGFRSFIYLFNNNNTMESFDCSNNFISDLTMKDCLLYLEYNHTLKYLNLYDNQLRNEIGTLLLDILGKNKTLLSINLLYNRVQFKIIDEINRKLKLNNEKEKEKYIPDLKRNIRDLEFEPSLFKKYIKEIKKQKKQQITLSQKIKEDNKNYNYLLEQQFKLVEEKQNYLQKINEELKLLKTKISDMENNIGLTEENLIINEKQIKNKISEETHELGKIEVVNLQLKAEYDLSKKEYEQIISDTNIKYRESQDKILDAQKSLNEINQNFNNKNKIYEDLNNPKLLVPILKKEFSKKKSSRKLRISKRFSALDNKVINKDNDNLLNKILESNNITASTSPTMAVNENNKNRNSLKRKSIKKQLQFNKNK